RHRLTHAPEPSPQLVARKPRLFNLAGHPRHPRCVMAPESHSPSSGLSPPRGDRRLEAAPRQGPRPLLPRELRAGGDRPHPEEGGPPQPAGARAAHLAVRARLRGRWRRRRRRPRRSAYEGRREFEALERAARQAGLARSRVREYVPCRMLEVEVAANAVYWWAAERILERRLPGERPADPAEYAAAVRLAAQTLRHRFHDKLMKAFLGPEVFEGTVVVAPRHTPATEQLRLG